MTHYSVKLPLWSARIGVTGGRVTSAAGPLRWAVGKTLVWLRHWASLKNGRVVELAAGAVHE